MSTRLDEGALNDLLLKRGRSVFKHLDGFHQPLWVRRVGIGGKDVDFVLINKSPARIAVVECTATLSGDLDQIRRYHRLVSSASPKKIRKCILRSLIPKGTPPPGRRTRARANRKSPLLRWVKRVDELDELIARAKAERNSVAAILLVYMKAGSGRALRFSCEVPLPRVLPGPDGRLVVVSVGK